MSRRWPVVTIALAACGQEPVTCPENLSIDISNVSLGVFTAVLNGKSGAVSTPFTCTQGGNGTVTGTVNGGQYAVTFTFAACVSQLALGTLTLDGSLTHQNNLNTHVETGHADALAIHGTDSTCRADPIDATCVVDWSFSGWDASNVPIGTGSVCGLAFP